MALEIAKNNRARSLALGEIIHVEKLKEIEDRYALNFADTSLMSNTSVATRKARLLEEDRQREESAEKAKYSRFVQQVNDDFKSALVLANAARDVLDMQSMIDADRQALATYAAERGVVMVSELAAKWEAAEAAARAEKARIEEATRLALKQAELEAWQAELDAKANEPAPTEEVTE